MTTAFTRRRGPFRRLRRGSLLYHGTSHPEDFRGFRGPAWVTNAHATARWFSRWMYPDFGGEPRILVYKVVRVPTLLKIEPTDHAVKRLARRFNVGEEHYEIAEALCEAGYDGWSMKRFYDEDGGDDIVLCDPMKVLKYVRTEES